MKLKALVPWWGKLTAKVILSRLQIDDSWWQRHGLFVHGAMHDPAYAHRVVMSHVARAGFSRLDGKVVVELGPGDSLSTAVIAAALGATLTYLSDTGSYATADIASYVTLQRFLEAAGMKPPDVSRCETVSDVLSQCKAVYLTNGLDGLRSIPSASVDLVFSQAVLEHVGLNQFAPTQREVRRVLGPGGIASHQVDLKDHLGGALNNLRFRDHTWEAQWMAESGFYTNRLRFHEILSLVAAADLVPEVTEVQRWTSLPTPKHRLAPRFREMAASDLLVHQFDFTARPRPF